MGGKFWGEVHDEESIEAVKAALDVGMNFIDTAHSYGRGHSEEIIGQALKGRREEAVICTKVSGWWDGDDYVYDCSYDAIMRLVEEGLKRLQTDYLDLYLIHDYDPKVPIKETMGALQKLKDEKVIRAVGVSNYGLKKLEEASKHIELHAGEYHLNMFKREQFLAIQEFCCKKNIGIMAFAPLAKGLLSGKFNGSEIFPANDNRSNNNWFKGEEFKKRVELVEKMKPIAAKHGKSMTQLAINWNLCQSGVISSLIGARNAEQVRENAGGSGWKLDPEDLLTIEELVINIQ